MRDTIITEMSGSYVEQINNYKTIVESVLNSDNSVTGSVDLIKFTEQHLDDMLKYHDRLELIENYFPITGSSEWEKIY